MGNKCCRSCSPKPPAGAEHQITYFVFGGSGPCCGTGCSKPWTFHKMFCCGPCKHEAPDHPGWRAAEPEMDVLFGEVQGIVDISKKCCGCGIDYVAVQSSLRASGWVDRANGVLARHGLVCDLHQFTTVVYNGTSVQVQQHLHLRLFELNDATTALYANPTASEVAGYGATGSVKTGPSGGDNQM